MDMHAQQHTVGEGGAQPPRERSAPLDAPHREGEGRLLAAIDDVCDMVSLGRSQIYAMVADGRFPAPLSLGRRCSRWRVADVRAWVEGLA